MFALHAPDHYLDPWLAVVTGLLAAGLVLLAVRRAPAQLSARTVPLAAAAAAFLFGAQMFNFPVASGTTGHLIGGALVAVILGPWVAMLVVASVVVVQAVVFADGGLTALGYNVVNMAVVPVFGGWAAYRVVRRGLPAGTGGIVASTALAATASVVLAAGAFSLEWMLGGAGSASAGAVLTSMVGVHLLIGVGEGLISVLVVGAVLLCAPSVGLAAERTDAAAHLPAERGSVVIGLAGAAVVLAAVVSQFAAGGPDGLERVAELTGFASAAGEHALAASPFADYATSGVDHRALGLALAGTVGVMLTFVLGWATLGLARLGGRRI